VREAIFRGEDLDVQELDGASNRGINEAKEVIARSVIAPLGGRKRICIIDEVHMLTREAFNALLKTMEEPPAHAMFILCTTDPEKVPTTILSRCQRYDFRPVSRERLTAHLHDVLQQEGVQAEMEALALVAEAGRGSVRDALSLLDRVLSADAESVTLTGVRELLGLATVSPAQLVARAVAEADARGVLSALAEAFQNGAEPEEVASDLAACFRDAMLFAVGGVESVGLHLSEGRQEDLEMISAALPADYLASGVGLADEAARAAKSSSTPRAVVEAMLLKLVFDLGGRVATNAPSKPSQKKKPEQVSEVKPLAQSKPSAKPSAKPSESSDSRPTERASSGVQQPHSPRTSPQSSPEPKERSHQSSKPAVAIDPNGWSTFLASVEGDVRSEVRVESFGTPTFLGDCLSFQNPDPSSFATAQRISEQEWLQSTLHRFGMVGVRVEVKVPVDHEDAQSIMQQMQGHPLIQELARALEGEVVGVQKRSEARDV
ncbi:MAG: DNA polymerase III subunit gamma/tau, partial [Planctomycetota bacterium]|nr:DNA polymerase III subunit gamma/tau [Planctomycetota bacterium]